jgi:hypothetical protein
MPAAYELVIDQLDRMNIMYLAKILDVGAAIQSRGTPQFGEPSRGWKAAPTKIASILSKWFW